MKKSLILGVLGLAAGAVTSFGQGAIQFNSYSANGGDGILTTFGAGVAGQTAGSGLSSGWTAGLLYSLSPIVDQATTALTASDPLLAGWTFAPNTAIFQSSAAPGATGLGYYIGQNFSLAGSPDGTVVYFEIIAYQTGSTYDASVVRGHSAAFTGVLKATPNTPITMDNMAPFSVFTATVPEPTTLALAGLGGLASLVMLRRKKA